MSFAAAPLVSSIAGPVGRPTVDVRLLTRPPSYGKLFSSIFAHRALYAVGLSSVGLQIFMLSLDALCLFKNVRSGRIIVVLAACMVSLAVLVIIRIRLFTRKSQSLLNRFGLEMLGASFLFSLTFTYGYLSLYRPDSVTALFYPEGRYGPPLLREQFLGALVFAGISSIAGFVVLAVLPSGCLLFSQERLLIEDEVKEACQRATWMLPTVSGAMLVSYLGSMSIAGPSLLRISRLILRQFIPIRPTFHSFRACIEPGALYQFVWLSAALYIIWESVNLIISVLFANSFKVTQHAPSRPMQVLLEGLQQEGHPLIQEQAIFELHQILMKDPAGRARLFSEFTTTDDRPASRMIAEWLARKMGQGNERMRVDLELLKGIETALMKAPLGGANEGQSQRPLAPTGETIFVIKPESALSGLVRRIFHRSTESLATAGSAKHDDANAVPEILRMKPSRLFVKAATIEPVVESKGTISWLSRTIWPMTEYTLGRYLAGFIIQYYRTRTVLEGEKVSIWLIQSISRLALVSLEEDLHGQVQLTMSHLLSALLQAFFLLLDLHNSPPPSERIQEVALSDEGDQAFHRLLHEVSGAVEEIRGAYGDEDLRGLLDLETKERLDAYQKLLSE